MKPSIWVCRKLQETSGFYQINWSVYSHYSLIQKKERFKSAKISRDIAEQAWNTNYLIQLNNADMRQAQENYLKIGKKLELVIEKEHWISQRHNGMEASMPIVKEQ